MLEKITLIIPVYNGESYIRQCLDSAINQSYRNFEIIVVDDGSTDQTYEICREYQKNCDFLRILHRCANHGLVYSWKEGVLAADSEYIAFLDADDWLDRAYLEELASGISQDADVVCCNHNKVYSDRTTLVSEQVAPGIYTAQQIRTKIFPKLLNDGSYLGRSISPHRCGKLFRRKLIQENLKYSSDQISYGEDLNIFFAVMLDCSRLLMLDDTKGLYYYWQNEKSIVHAYQKGMFEQIRLLRNKLFDIMNSKDVYDFKDQINADFWCLFLEYVKNETKADNFIRRAGEVCRNFKSVSHETPYQMIEMKITDRFLMHCLKRHLWGFVYIWMGLFFFAKRIYKRKSHETKS